MEALVALRRAACLSFACASLWLPASLEVAAETAAGGAARTLIDGTDSNIHHLDLLVQQPYDASTSRAQPPWFDGFGGRDGVAAVTVGHPIQRILLHLRAEGVGLEEGMSWPERGGVYYVHERVVSFTLVGPHTSISTPVVLAQLQTACITTEHDTTEKRADVAARVENG